MALTGKKKLFADAVLGGSSNKEAAIKAGYSAATASAAGSRLVKDIEVADYVNKMRKSVETGTPPPSDGPKFDLAAAMQHSDPKVFLMAAMNDVELDPKQRIIAAKALLPIFYGKVADAGKKDGQKDAAKKVGTGKFGASAPPRLVVNNR